MEKIIKQIEEIYNTKMISKEEMISIVIVKFENGISIDIPLKIIKALKEREWKKKYFYHYI